MSPAGWPTHALACKLPPHARCTSRAGALDDPFSAAQQRELTHRAGVFGLPPQHPRAARPMREATNKPPLDSPVDLPDMNCRTRSKLLRARAKQLRFGCFQLLGGKKRLDSGGWSIGGQAGSRRPACLSVKGSSTGPQLRGLETWEVREVIQQQPHSTHDTVHPAAGRRSPTAPMGRSAAARTTFRPLPPPLQPAGRAGRARVPVTTQRRHRTPPAPASPVQPRQADPDLTTPSQSLMLVPRASFSLTHHAIERRSAPQKWGPATTTPSSPTTPA